MPRLNERKEPRIPTYLNLTQRCRANLESAIGHGNIKTLTDAVEAASECLCLRISSTRKQKAAEKPPQGSS